MSMTFPYWLQRILYGTAIADRSYRRALEKEYKKCEETNQEVTSISPETFEAASDTNRPRLSKPTDLIPTRSRPLQVSLHSQSRPRFFPPTPPPHEVRGRKQGDWVQPLNMAESEGPVDASAPDLNPEQIRRNYSHDNVWNAEIHGPIIPLPEMTGFGRYRRARAADEAYQIDALHRTMSDLSDQMVAHACDEQLPELDPSVLQKYKAMREESATNLACSRNHSSPKLAQDYFDSRRHCRVSRGFSSSSTSSVASPTQEAFTHPQKGPTHSATKEKQEVVLRLSRRRSRQQSSHSSDKSHSSSLQTISEDPLTFDKSRRKIERPCEFENTRDPDSAVASGDDGEWEDCTSGPDSDDQRRLSRQLQEDNKATPLTRLRTNSEGRNKSRQDANIAAIERSRTVRQAVRPVLRRGIPGKKMEAKKVHYEDPSSKGIAASMKLIRHESDTPSPRTHAPPEGQSYLDATMAKRKAAQLSAISKEMGAEDNEEGRLDHPADLFSDQLAEFDSAIYASSPVRLQRRRSATVVYIPQANTRAEETIMASLPPTQQMEL